jgi:hypothetical protein
MEVHMNRSGSARDTLPEPGDAPRLPGYEEDFALWLDAQAALLRERKFDELDVENLIEEIEGMARSDRRELPHRLGLVLVHLLKYRYQPGHRSTSWLRTLREQRHRIARLVKDSPSLLPHIAEYADDEYRNAVAAAADETGLPLSSFPPSNPFTATELLDPDFLS